jgi:hypothetical protein
LRFFRCSYADAVAAAAIMLPTRLFSYAAFAAVSPASNAVFTILRYFAFHIFRHYYAFTRYCQTPPFSSLPLPRYAIFVYDLIIIFSHYFEYHAYAATPFLDIVTDTLPATLMPFSV